VRPYAGSVTAALFASACATPPQTPAREAPPAVVAPALETPPAANEAVQRGHDRSVARALAAAMIARNLPSNGAFASRRVSRAEMDRVVREQVVRELPTDALAQEEAQQKLLGAVDARDDYRELVLGMLGSQVAGLYVPREKALYVVDDDRAGSTTDDEHTVLVHEIVHAIQDEHFDLGARVRWREDGGDEVAAVHALGEGDATLAMFLEKSRGEALPDSFFESFTTLMIEGNRQLVGDRVPRALADALVAPYVEGLRFVRHRYAIGGWAAVDAAWRSPPTTTEQLLHPAKYEAREAALPMGRESVGPAGFETLTSGVVGELDLREWLAGYVATEDARALAGGWGQGRSELFGRGEERAVRLRIRWDYDARPHAARSAKSLERALEARLGRGRRVAGFVCFDRADLGPLALRAEGADLVVLAGPARLTPKEGTGTSRCSALAPWARRAMRTR
jgi:hypothetical protein